MTTPYDLADSMGFIQPTNQDLLSKGDDAITLNAQRAASLIEYRTYRRGPIGLNVDLDTLTTHGLYNCETGAVAKTVKNLPASAAVQPFSVLVTIVSVTNRITAQEFQQKTPGADTVKVYRRVALANQWGAWLDVTGSGSTGDTTLTDGVAVIGDSQSATATSWASLLGASTATPVKNYARSGDDSTTVAISAGVISVPVTSTTGKISASGDTTVKTGFRIPGGRQNRHASAGTLAGIAGSLYSTTDPGTFRFVRAVTGQDQSLSPGSLFVSSREITERTVIIWVGGNDFNNGATSDDGTTATLVLENYLRCKAFFESRGHRVLMCGTTPRASTPPGSTGFTEVKRINDYLESTWPGQFIPVAKFLATDALRLAGLTPTSADTAAMKAGTTPPQLLLDDGVHLTDKAQKTLHDHLMKPWLTSRGYITT